MTKQNNFSRRNFFKKSAVITAGSLTVPYFLSSAQPVRAEAASDKLRMGCIGVGDMGRGDANGFSSLVDIVALCDVDSLHLDIAQSMKNIGKKDAYKDYRKILERKDIDVVSIVTVDHWHTKIAIEALQAGKHVFCQKPLTLTIEENQLIRAACKKYGKVFQVGTQQRSQREQFLLAILMVQSGLLGDIKTATCDIGTSPACNAIPVASVPETLDFDLWLGQCPKVEYRATAQRARDGKADWPQDSRTHYQFRWWYEYGGGKFTDWGAHHIDIALWALNQTGQGQGPKLFKPVIAEHPVPFKDGYPTVDDRYNASSKFHIECQFENGTVMNVVSSSPDGNGILFEGTKGKIHVSRSRIKGKPFEEIGGKLRENGTAVPYGEMPEIQKLFPESEFEKLYNGKKFIGHKQNFIDCIKNGGLPVSDVYTHTQAMNSCHLCAIAARLGRDVAWDAKTEKTGDSQSQSFIAREQRKGFEIPRE
ncbi:NADH-dependent dehydrogenase [Planctomycetales bacterium]|nr:NADH-dependent dehydrogenase [Planctomycetales bacterium]